MRAPAVLALVALLTASACGLRVLGASTDAPDGSTGVPSPNEDAGLLPSPPVPPGCECNTPTPADWVRVGFGATRTASCPAGYDADDVVEGPSAQSGACTCGPGCTVTSAPSCSQGVLAIKVDGTACSNTFGNIDVLSDTCGNYTFSITSKLQISPPQPTGGSCTAPAVAHVDAVMSSAERLCIPTAAACPKTALCSGAAVGECVAHEGDVPCPAAPWTQRHVTGRTVELTCSETCTCAVTGTCGGTVTAYANTGCTGSSFALPVDGVCHSYSDSTQYHSYRYTSAVGSATCAGTGTSTGTAGLDGVRTVCCK